MNHNPLTAVCTEQHDDKRRHGSMITLGMFTLIACLGLVALTVDVGLIGLTRTDMQKAVDAAALAAAQEVAEGIRQAAEQGLPPSEGIELAVGGSRTMAELVAQLNDVFVDPAIDVEFGKRVYDPGSGTFSINWGDSPPNAVKVTARRDNPNLQAPDGKIPLFFSPVSGATSTSMTTSAVAYIEARDFVVVLDFSGSMNDDTGFDHLGSLSLSDLESNLDDCWKSVTACPSGGMGFN
jgi:uncharacterized membrane protein